MKQIRFIVLVFAFAGFAFGQGSHQEPGDAGVMLSLSPQHQVIVRAMYQDMYTRIPPPQITDHPATATFIVTYNGFTPAAQAAFQRAVDIWSSLLVSAVSIRVTANWTPLGPGILGSAGASTIYRDFSGAPQPGTWYAVALAEKLAGIDLNATTTADINANFSSSISNWYYGTDGNPPPGQFDLVSIVLHELGHGLTFFGSMTVSSGQGSWGLGTGFPVVYDRFAETGAGQSLINTTLFPNPSATLATQLQSNAVFFNGPQAVAGNGGTRPPLYVPASWISGSSYSHLNESTYPAGNPNSLMTPSFGTAEAIHNPGPVALGMFRDMGWTTTSVSVNDYDAESHPVTVSLYQNFPNPFNPSTTIQYRLAAQSHVTIKVYDVMGRELETLVDGDLYGGYHDVRWDATAASSGVYFCRIDIKESNSSGMFHDVRKMTVIK